MSRRAAWAVAAAVLAAAVLAGWALYDSLFPIFLGFGLAYAFDPAADWLEARGLSRTAAVSILLGAVGAVFLISMGVVVPVVTREAAEFIGHFPDYAGRAVDRLLAMGASWGLPVPERPGELLERLREKASGISLRDLSPAGRLAAGIFSGAAGLLVGVLNMVVVPVAFFYFLRDISSLRRGVLDLAPPRRRAWLATRLDEADRVFSGYLRGQMSVACILAVLYSVGLSIVGVRFGIVIGILAGLLNIVPYVGVGTGLTLSLVMALVDFTGWGRVIGVLAVFGVAQLLEGFVITPRVVGDKVGLSPVETIIALIVGGEMGGLLGLILAIPVAGCLKVYARDLVGAWRRSPAYQG